MASKDALWQSGKRWWLFLHHNIDNICQNLPFFNQKVGDVMMATMNVSLPDGMREWVESQTKSGDYANVSDYIRDLIRHDKERREALKLAIQEGLDSGASSRKAEDILAERKAQLKNG